MESPNSAALRECQLLPCSSINKDNIKRITSGTLSKLINGEFNDQCDRYMILDCRFAEEYNGGHIKNAIHMSAVDQIDNILFNSPPADGERAVLVLHCEFSQVRGPTIAQQIRQRDRALNVHRYPQLYYPELYVLQGGYRAFYQSFPDNC
ncbi:Rhodanese-like protein, partial [Ramicandelaber brevisporus]